MKDKQHLIFSLKHEALLRSPDYSFFINVLNEKDKVQSNTASVWVTFTAT